MIATSLAIQYLAGSALALALFFTFRRISVSLLKVGLLLGFYGLGLPALYRLPQLQASWEADLVSGMAIPLAVIVLAAMIFAAVAYFIDRYFDKAPQGHFKGGALFFRYGRQFYHSIVPIGLEEGATAQDMEGLVERLYDYLRSHLHEQFANREDIQIKQLNIRDQGWKGRGEKRERYAEKLFLRISFQTPRKAKLHYFIHLNHLGHQLLAHHYAYLQGRHYWHHVLVFIAAAPFHAWFWAFRWVGGRYSIQSRLNRHFDPSSFDRIDLSTGFESLRFNLMMAMLRFAKVYGLMAEELEKAISNPPAQALGFPRFRFPGLPGQVRGG